MQDLADYFRSLPQTHKETKRWSIKDGIIYDNGEPLDLARFERELKVISLYFREWQKFGNLEAQVLVVTKEDYEKYYTQFAILPVESNSNALPPAPESGTFKTLTKMETSGNVRG